LGGSCEVWGGSFPPPKKRCLDKTLVERPSNRSRVVLTRSSLRPRTSCKVKLNNAPRFEISMRPRDLNDSPFFCPKISLPVTRGTGIFPANLKFIRAPLLDLMARTGAESDFYRILKMGQHLPKLWARIKCLVCICSTFCATLCIYSIY